MTDLLRSLMLAVTYSMIAAQSSRAAQWTFSNWEDGSPVGNSEVSRIRWIAINKTFNVSSISFVRPLSSKAIWAILAENY